MSERLPAFLESELQEAMRLAVPGGPNHDRIMEIVAGLKRRYGQEAIVEALGRIAGRGPGSESEPAVIPFPTKGPKP